VHSHCAQGCIDVCAVGRNKVLLELNQEVIVYMYACKKRLISIKLEIAYMKEEQ